MNSESQYQIKLFGYCALTQEEILNKFLQSGASELTSLTGEYIIVIENQDEAYLISSPYGVCQYYYTLQENQFFHDDTVIGVLKKSRLPWTWNWTALADLTLFDHLIENDTLHAQIHRVPRGSILHFKQGHLKTSSLTWEELNPSFPAKAETALNQFNQAIKTWMGDKPVVSMSGGFDSRVILSGVLQQGGKPLLLTMGYDDTTDVIVSKKIASALGLDLELIQLDFADYFKHSQKIVSLTNGTKTIRHWHTYLYTYHASLDRNSKFFVGTNGEFVRATCYDELDKGILALKENLNPIPSLRKFWASFFTYLFKTEELQGLQPELSAQFNPENQEIRMHRIIDLCHHQFLSGMNRFYLEQRVRNFHGNGLKLYSENVDWRAPFLTKEWVSTTWNLPRGWKFGSNWHRFAIQKNYPRLLDFPEEGKSETMPAKAPLFYWHPSKKKYPVVSYSRYPDWFQSEPAVEFIMDNFNVLEGLIDKNTLASIVKEHQQKKNRTYTMAFLLTMTFWLMQVKEVVDA